MGPISRPRFRCSQPIWATETSSPHTSICTPPPRYSTRPASVSSVRMGPSSSRHKRRPTVSTDNTLSNHLRTFFHDHLTAQRNVSPHTLLAYRDAIKLLFQFTAERLRKPVAGLVFEDLGVKTVLGFLTYLETNRTNSVATRNARLAALHVFYRHVAARDPISFASCQRVLAIPAKRGPSHEVDYLERDEMEAILRAPDRATPAGRRDYALISFAWQTGARVGEIIALRA